MREWIAGCLSLILANYIWQWCLDLGVDPGFASRTLFMLLAYGLFVLARRKYIT